MMVDFETVVRDFWKEALLTIEEWDCVGSDRKGFSAIEDKNLPTRRDNLRSWLRSYSVFQGLTAAQRDQITEAVLVWADTRDPHRDLATPEALAAAHAELMEATCRAFVLNSADVRERDFTSLASKALWLCYPDSVPIYDSYARNTLHVISKIENGITPISENRPEYEKFVHVWKQLYARCKGTVESLDIGAYPYRVRVFDIILWLVGRPSYHADWRSARPAQL